VLEKVALIVIIGIFIAAGVAGIMGKPIKPCTSGTSSITKDGKSATIWYPKGCYHR
jgi:hypothetical protein